MDAQDLRARIKSGNLAGWYLMCGEEDYLKKYYMNELRAVIVADEAFAPFNYAAYDGEDINFGEVAEHIKSPPMMSDYKLIEWRFASLDGLKESEKTASEPKFYKGKTEIIVNAETGIEYFLQDL